MARDGVTIRELYDLLERLEEKIDKRFDFIESNHFVHINSRLTKIENRTWWFLGGIAGLTAAFNVYQIFIHAN